MIRAVARRAGSVAAICALILGVATGCGEDNGSLASSTSSESSTTTTQCPRVPVVVAAMDIPAGTTGAEAASNGMLREDEISAHYRPATAVTSLDQVADGVAVDDFAANQVVTLGHFGLSTDTTLPPPPPGCMAEGSSTTLE